MWRRGLEVQTEHQNGEERGFKRLWTWNGCSDGLVWVFQKLLIYWDFYAQPSLGFTENGPKNRKYPVSGSCVENALLMSEICTTSAKNRKRRLQFTQALQNLTIGDWKNVAWSCESRFLLRHSDGRVRIWRKEHESMDPFCLVSTVQAGGGGVMVWGIFSWHTLGPLPIQHPLNTTAYPSNF